MVTESGEPDAVLAHSLINSTGLSAPFILDSFLNCMNRPRPLLPLYYAKGSYASYHSPGVSTVRHLIYPVPALASKRTVSQDWGHTLPSIFQGTSTSDLM